MKIEYIKDEKQRIDKYIVSLEMEELYSRSFIDKLLSEEAILVNGKPVKKNYKLSRFDIITIEVPQKKELDIKPQNIPIDIIWEDDDIAVVNWTVFCYLCENKMDTDGDGISDFEELYVYHTNPFLRWIDGYYTNESIQIGE